MANRKNNSANLSVRPGLYRVWVPLHDDGKTPLISIWIDPAMKGFERDQHLQGLEDAGSCSANGEARADEIDESWRCIRVALFARESATETIQ
jgi:hypothetical protein